MSVAFVETTVEGTRVVCPRLTIRPEVVSFPGSRVWAEPVNEARPQVKSFHGFFNQLVCGLRNEATQKHLVSSWTSPSSRLWRLRRAWKPPNLTHSSFKMWLGGAPHVVVRTLNISLDRHILQRRSLIGCCRVM